jgi:hypothetical protein
MKIDFPGKMQPFTELNVGTFFIYFDGQTPAFGMKDSDNNLLSFTYAIHPNKTPPTILARERFENRDVCVLENVVFRPIFKVEKLCDGPPPQGQPGSIIIAGDGKFIRAWSGNQTQDVNITTGAVGASFAHPGGMWIADWQIVLLEGTRETILCERAEPQLDSAGLKILRVAPIARRAGAALHFRMLSAIWGVS